MKIEMTDQNLVAMSNSAPTCRVRLRVRVRVGVRVGVRVRPPAHLQLDGQPVAAVLDAVRVVEEVVRHRLLGRHRRRRVGPREAPLAVADRAALELECVEDAVPDAERAGGDAVAPHLAHPAEVLHRLGVAHDPERELVPRLDDARELLDVDHHGRRPHRVGLAAEPLDKPVDDARLPPRDHVAEVERGGHRRRRQVGQRPQHQVVGLRNVDVVLHDDLAEPLVRHKLHHRVRPVDDDVAGRLRLLDHERRDLVDQLVGLLVARREQPREAAHLAARVARPLHLEVVVHDAALPRLVAARRRGEDGVVRPWRHVAARPTRDQRRGALWSVLHGGGEAHRLVPLALVGLRGSEAVVLRRI